MVFFRKKDRKGITNVEKINCSTCHSFENYSVSEFDVYDIEEPVVGKLPDTDAFSVTPGCEVAEVKRRAVCHFLAVPAVANGINP